MPGGQAELPLLACPAGRRLQNLGGIVHKKGLIASPLPGWLQSLLARLAGETGIWGGEPGQPLLPNHVLINAYQVQLFLAFLTLSLPR